MEDQHEEKSLLNNDGHETQLINAFHIDQAQVDVMVLDRPAGGASIDSSCTSSISRPIPPFLLKLYDMLSNEETNSFVAWSPTGTSFVIKDPHAFCANVLPMYFRHNNFQSFVSQLNSYGFKKTHWDKWEYKNEYFQKGGRHLMRNINRKNSIHHTMHQPNFDIDLSLNVSPSYSSNEIDSSMKEYNMLKIEVMKLKEKQQTLDEKLASLQYQLMHILKEPTNSRELKMDDNDETHLKGKRKLGEITMCSDDVAGSCPGASKTNVIADPNCEIVLAGNDMEKHPESTLISLEDLMGESECSEFIRELHDKINHPKP